MRKERRKGKGGEREKAKDTARAKGRRKVPRCRLLDDGRDTWSWEGEGREQWTVEGGDEEGEERRERKGKKARCPSRCDTRRRSYAMPVAI